MTIKKINRAACKTIRTELDAELEELGKRLGLTIKAGNASFGDTSVTFKVDCVLEGVDKAKEEFARDCFLYNLPETAYKAEFQHGGKTWILEGLKTRSPKYPIIASKKGEDGKYKLPESAIASLREVQKAELTA